MVQKLTAQNYEQSISTDKPVLIDFFATWCGPCKMLAPVIDELSEKLADRFVFCKADVDEEATLARQFGVSVIPTLIVLKGGKSVAVSTGFMEKGALEEWLTAASEK